ncbi:response regulator transcription factor [Kitasatospora sp. NPDC059327]|uniref:response regulator transcription factor n=1 Tax=Kitasatospora sp. NPDC059327 TaxID=3346803 RepID=UPI00367BC415
MIKVLIGDDQQLVRAGVRMLCESTSDLTVVGEAAKGTEALRFAEQPSPEVVLMDLHMPAMDGTSATGSGRSSGWSRPDTPTTTSPIGCTSA